MCVALVLLPFCQTAFGQEDRPDDPPPNDPAPSGQIQPAPSKYRDPKTLSPNVFNLAASGGRGLIGTLSPYSLPPGKVGVGATLMNFDRNPGDVDFVEGGLQLAFGLPGRMEVFFRGAPVLRTNSVGQDPVGFPVPPLDLFVDTYPTDALRRGPHFAFAQEAPFKSYYLAGVNIDPPGHGAFGQSSGDVAVGLKVNLLSEDRDNPMGFGVRGYVEVPTERPWYNTPYWRDRAGVSGKTDMGFDLLAAKRLRITELLMNVGYRHVGDPYRGIRLQYVDSSRTDAGFLVGPTQEIRLDLHDRLKVSAGGSFPVFAIKQRQVFLVTEFDYTRYIGHGTPVDRLAHPVELRTGLQVNFPWYKPVAAGIAYQVLLTHVNGDLRASVLRTADGKGDINFSENVNPSLSAEVQAFLASRGATFSPNSSRVFSTNNSDFDMWRNISPAAQRVVAQGNANLLIYVTWRVN